MGGYNRKLRRIEGPRFEFVKGAGRDIPAGKMDFRSAYPVQGDITRSFGIIKHSSMSALFSNRSVMLAVAIVAVCLVGSARAQSSPTAGDLMDSMIEALGGDAYLNVKEIEASGRFFTFRRDEVAALDLYSDYIKFPDRERTEFGKDKQKRIQINNGQEGWNVTPPPNGKGDPQVLPQSPRETEEFLQNFKTSFDYMMRFVVNDRRTTLVHTGSETVDYKRTDVVEIRDAAKNLMRVFIDRQSHLPVKVQMRRADSSVIDEESYANWHAFDGVTTPLMVVRYKDGLKTMEIRAEKVAYNTGLSPDLFASPDAVTK